MRDLKKLIEELNSLESLNDWERGFLESVTNQFNRNGNLSDKQVETLDKIQSKHSPEAIKQRKEWEESYAGEKKEIAVVCAKYYMATGYFADLSRSILDDGEFVPTERQFAAMCENKYANIKARLLL